jgi:cytochrome c553
MGRRRLEVWVVLASGPALALAGLVDAAVPAVSEPLWAYGFDRPAEPHEKALPQAPPNRNLRMDESALEQTRPRRLPGSDQAFSMLEIRDGQNVIDWFPGDHPPMPEVVAHGPSGLGPRRRGCAACHLPNGEGRPENAAPAGLPVAYFLRQMEDFRRGRRQSADPRKANTGTMIELARGLSDAELESAARYFAALPFTPRVRVVETARVPRTRIVNNLFLPLVPRASSGDDSTEPLGGRIVEMPEDPDQSELYRNPRSGFVAYVPVGSVARGRALVTTGREGLPACVTCHRQDLGGVADVPPLAGRSPSYLVRQLWDIRQGTRRGSGVAPMRSVVATLDATDLVDIAAYVASRPPTAIHYSHPYGHER